MVHKYDNTCNCLDCMPEGNTKLVPKQPANMGFNSAVIKPETRANKTESANQKVGCPLKEPLKQDQRPICDNCENPNLMIIKEIEGLMSQVNEKLVSLDDGHYVNVKATKKNQALQEIDLFQKTTLFELRKAFE